MFLGKKAYIKVFHRSVHWLENMLYMQLVLTFFSLPILLSWGLPISVLTVVGNIIFSPCILVFLLLSALFFFGQLLTLPVDWIGHLLDWVTTCWLKIIHIGSKQALLAIPKPALWLAITISLIPLIIMYSSWGNNRRHVIALLFGLLFCFTLALKFMVPAQATLKIPWNERQSLTALYDRGTCILVDFGGIIRHRANLKPWVTFTLNSTLSKQLGTTNCSAIIQMRPTVKKLAATYELAQVIGATTVFVPETDMSEDFMQDTNIRIIPIALNILRSLSNENGPNPDALQRIMTQTNTSK